MNQEYEKMMDMGKKIQESLYAFAELNVKTIQDCLATKPEEYTKIPKSTDMVEMMIAHNRRALDYMQQASDIMEKTILSLAPQKTKK